MQLDITRGSPQPIILAIVLAWPGASKRHGLAVLGLY